MVHGWQVLVAAFKTFAYLLRHISVLFYISISHISSTNTLCCPDVGSEQRQPSHKAPESYIICGTIQITDGQKEGVIEGQYESPHALASGRWNKERLNWGWFKKIRKTEWCVYAMVIAGACLGLIPGRQPFGYWRAYKRCKILRQNRANRRWRLRRRCAA